MWQTFRVVDVGNGDADAVVVVVGDIGYGGDIGDARDSGDTRI